MKKLATILLLFLCMSCQTWEIGKTYTQHIEAGEHAAKPIVLKFTKVWGGICTLEYDTELMTVPDGWSKLGGLMPDINDNIGEKQSARMGWRIAEDPNYFYLGYIIYEGEVERGYLLDDHGDKMQVRVGDEFDARVINYGSHWGVSALYNGQHAFKRFDVKLKERFMVGMDLYYGGDKPAPCDIDLTIEVVDTNWNYFN